MNVDVSQEALFQTSEIKFCSKVNFVFGKNGTGKSTITRMIKEQNSEKDVHIFHGFEGVVDENKHLNAVVLGKNNTTINKEINALKLEIDELKKERAKIEKNITLQVDDENNLWMEKKRADEQYSEKEKEIMNFFTEAAANIKKQKNPQISATGYNTRNIQMELENSQLLQFADKEKYTAILKSDVKNARDLFVFEIDLDKYLSETNSILTDKVEEKVIIKRIEGNTDKRRFAESGLKIHSRGDVCAFCGNKIEEAAFSELEKYFSADEVKAFQNKINTLINEIVEVNGNIDKIQMDVKEFYADYQGEVIEFQKRLNKIKEEYYFFLNMLTEALKDKLVDIYTDRSELKLELPAKIETFHDEYVVLMKKNNSNDLEKKQHEAMDKLRYHRIKELLDEFKYDSKIAERSLLKDNRDKVEEKFNLELDKSNKIIENIEIINGKIKKLQEETQNEKILAGHINGKLSNMVSFELVHCEVKEGKGFYQIKSLITNEIRDITKLSSGERNVIAFLYFIEKLNEINEENIDNKKRIIIFDDPMNSNDDNMQYLIMEELQMFMKNVNDSDVFILLTHNNHFYINVKYGRKYDKDTFIRLESNGKNTEVKYIEKQDEDFKTSYEALWEEVKFLYCNDMAAAGMLLNPLRRIIETYTKFNCISQKEFCEKQLGSKKLFDVNSHSIDDLEADLNGKSKEEIMEIVKMCFEFNGALNHFNVYWENVSK